MFAVLLVFAFVTANAAKLPSYVHVCGRRDPNYNQCYLDNLNKVKNELCKGIPEFDVQPIEPIIIDKIVVFDTNELKLYLNNLKIYGFCNSDIKSLSINPDTLNFNFDFLVKNLTIDTLFDIDVHLLVSFAHKGLIHVFIDNLDGKLFTDLTEVTKNNKKHVYVSKVTTHLNLETFRHEFDSSNENLTQLNEIFKSVINENMKEVINKIRPSIEEVISKLTISVTNNVTHNRAELLYPYETP